MVQCVRTKYNKSSATAEMAHRGAATAEIFQSQSKQDISILPYTEQLACNALRYTARVNEGSHSLYASTNGMSHACF